MDELKILNTEDVIKNGAEFDGDIVCFSGQFGQQVYYLPMEEGGKPVQGIVYEKHDNGNLAYYCFYKEGIQHGENVSFYETGKIKNYCNMEKGTILGYKIELYENGKLKRKSDCCYGFIKSFQEWNEDGILIKQQTEPDDFTQKMIEKYDNIEAKRKNE